MAEPKFVPEPGQTDYTDIRYAPVVNSVVIHGGKVLLAQRSPDMRLYPSYWNGISGFLDDMRSVEDKVAQELYEEIGLGADDIESIERGTVFLQEAPEYKKTWIVVPALVRVNRVEFNLNWETKRAEWFAPDEVLGLNLLPGFDEVIKQFLSEI